MGKLSHGGLGGPGKANPALLSFGMGIGDKSGCQLSAWRREKGPETLGVETDPKSDGIWDGDGHVLVSSTHRGIFPACREKGWNGKRMETRGVQPDRDESREYFLAGIPRRSRTRHRQPPGCGGRFFIGLRDVREYSLESLRTRDARPTGTPNPSASQAGMPASDADAAR